MIVRGVELGRVPRVAGVIAGEANGRLIGKSIKDGADFLELRVDTFKDRGLERLTETIKKIRDSGLPVILTVRSKKEGGRYAIDDKERVKVFNALLPFADIVDIELSSNKKLGNVIDSAKSRGKKVIISYHNFKSTPGVKFLEDLTGKGQDAGGDIIKIAALARGRDDLRRLARVLIDSPGEMIVIAMGSYGAASRIFYPILGSLLTYGSITEETAPGQFSLKTIKKEFRTYGFS